MDARIKLTLVVATVASLSACGFKSDVVVPDKENPDGLFIPDTELPAGDTGELLTERPPFLPDSVDGVEVMTDEVNPVDDTEAGQEIRIESITIEASDGEILIDSDGSSVDIGTDNSDNSGVPVDFSDLTNELEDNRKP